VARVALQEQQRLPGLACAHPGRQAGGPPWCRRELEPFTLPKPRSVLQRMGLRLMPTAAQLEAAGRRDLAQAVRRAGGFLEVAQVRGGGGGGAPAALAAPAAPTGETLAHAALHQSRTASSHACAATSA
jgi:hypothetical protein